MLNSLIKTKIVLPEVLVSITKELRYKPIIENDFPNVDENSHSDKSK